MHIDPIFELQLIDYRSPSASSAFALTAAIETALNMPRPAMSLPPDPPPMPFEYLRRLSAEVEAPHVTPEDQDKIIANLRSALEEESDDPVRADIVRILRPTRAR